jgi:small subunit ribosomal protein S16
MTKERKTMAVKIRMTRMGKRNCAFFRINAIDSRTPRDGKIIEKLGHYDPIEKDKSKQVVLNTERIKYWLDKGAIPSDTVSEILLKVGIKTKYAEERVIRRSRARAIVRAKGQPFTKAERVAAGQVAAEAEAKTEASEEPGKKVEAKAATKAETKAETVKEVEAKPQAKQEAEVKVETPKVVEEKPETKAGAEPKAKEDVVKEAEAKTEAKQEAEEKQKPESKKKPVRVKKIDKSDEN